MASLRWKCPDRQVTLTALRALIMGTPMADADFALPYKDVSDAWNHYLEHDAVLPRLTAVAVNGRGVGFALIASIRL
jgi:hypothetical protein